MREMLKYRFLPSVWGVIACVLLIVTCVYGNGASGFMQAVNALLGVIALCICIHFVRGTAQLYGKHVWEMPSLITLICMQIFNLLVVGLQFVLPDAGFLHAAWFSVLLIFFSIPAFFCYYFIYVTRKYYRYKSLLVSSVILCAVGLVYILFRLFDKVIAPIAEKSGAQIAPELLRIAGESSWVSVSVYALSILCFFILGFVFAEENRKAES